MAACSSRAGSFLDYGGPRAPLSWLQTFVPGVLAADDASTPRPDRSGTGLTCKMGEGTIREPAARRLPKLVGHSRAVRGLFRRSEAQEQLAPRSESLGFAEGSMVGATGIEPVTPTMSR
jgi:hypothetical protein